jgi:FKBP-type peptidyl-prolyl cis-trans isomerase FkpA
MKIWKPILGLSILCAACAAPAPEPETAQKPANPFEESFSHEAGVRPITWGGWIKTLTPGTGASPNADSVVKVNYRGTLTDGTEFDSSLKRGPATFSLRNVISCWTNGVPMMKVGEKAKFVCPSAAAYGDQGSPPVIPGGATLVFEIELLDIVR